VGAEWLIVRSERPLNAETPPHLLCRSWVTPAEFFFVRNHGSIPAVDASEYRLTVGGAVARAPAIPVQGYAIGAAGCPVERVEVSCDQGRTWLPAALQGGSEWWTWRVWHAAVEVTPRLRELIVGAWDGPAARQPEYPSLTWNPRGYLNNAWHRVRVACMPRGPANERVVPRDPRAATEAVAAKPQPSLRRLATAAADQAPAAIRHPDRHPTGEGA
jgi:hypothetical protein